MICHSFYRSVNHKLLFVPSRRLWRPRPYDWAAGCGAHAARVPFAPRRSWPSGRSWCRGPAFVEVNVDISMWTFVGHSWNLTHTHTHRGYNIWSRKWIVDDCWKVRSLQLRGMLCLRRRRAFFTETEGVLLPSHFWCAGAVCRPA